MPAFAPRARDALLSASDVATLIAVTGALEGDEAAAYVNTAAGAASQGAVAVSAFVVAMFARAVAGEAAEEQERSRQARCLAGRLELQV